MEYDLILPSNEVNESRQLDKNRYISGNIVLRNSNV